MTALDTSVVVAAFATWHENHSVAVAALARRPRLIAHVALEAYAVLTRLPPPHRVSGGPVREFLGRNFREPALVLAGRRYRRLLEDLAAHGITGGGAYDALVATTARDADVELVSLDQRARPVYEALSIRFTMLERGGRSRA